MWARSRGSTTVAPGSSLEEARSLQTILVVIDIAMIVVIVIVKDTDIVMVVVVNFGGGLC